jgi:hypothetical protein
MHYLHKCVLVLSSGHLSIREQKEEEDSVVNSKEYIYIYILPGRRRGEERKIFGGLNFPRWFPLVLLLKVS